MMYTLSFWCIISIPLSWVEWSAKPRIDPMPYNDAGRDYWKDPKMREQLVSADCFSSKFVIFTGSTAESIKSFRHQMARFYEQYYKNLSLGPRVNCPGDECSVDKPLWMCIQWHLISNNSGRNGTNYSEWFRRKFDVGSLSRVSMLS